MRIGNARGGGVNRIGIDDIQRLDFGGAAGICDLSRHRFQLRHAPSRQDYRCPSLRQRQCARPANTCARPGYPSYFPRDRLHIGPSYLLKITRA